MKNRSIAYKRHKDYHKSKRLHDITKSWGWERERGYFVKGKIHCSCFICSTKRKYYGTPISDLRKPQMYEETGG